MCVCVREREVYTRYGLGLEIERQTDRAQFGIKEHSTGPILTNQLVHPIIVCTLWKLLHWGGGGRSGSFM